MNKAPSTKPRRPHNKSRTGCTQCKTRKIKCDETKPTCQKCEGYGAPCSFLQTHPQPRGGPPTLAPSNFQQRAISAPVTSSTSVSTPSSQSLSQPLPTNFTILDLEILHSWSTDGVKTFSPFSEVHELYSKTMMEFAFKNEFVMHRVLALSALHMAHINPEQAAKYHFAADNHSATGLSLFLHEIGNLGPSNCEACFLFSSMTFLHAWATQDMSKPSTMFFFPTRWSGDWEAPIRWIRLNRGSRTIISATWSDLTAGPLAQLFDPWAQIGFGRGWLEPGQDDNVASDDKQALNNLTRAWDNEHNSEYKRTTLSESLAVLKRTFNMLATETPGISDLSIVMAWFSHLSEEFFKLVEDKTPEALLLVAYYCVTLKRLPSLWWNDGRAENFLETILEELGAEWEEYTQWPIEHILGGRKGKKSPMM